MWASPVIWREQLNASWLSLLMTFLIIHACNGFAEGFFHRYCLHMALIPGLETFFKRHQVIHHTLTQIDRERLEKSGRVVYRIIENKYPIIEDEQHQSSTFPWYSYAVFSLIGSIFFLPAQLLFPRLPIFLGAFLAIGFSLSLYEILHAIEHLSYERFWKTKLDHPKWNWFWFPVYTFHLHHHLQMSSNESISGFFGLPLFDWVFGTYVSSNSTYQKGMEVEEMEVKKPRPYWPLRTLDRFAYWILSWRRRNKQMV